MDKAFRLVDLSAEYDRLSHIDIYHGSPLVEAVRRTGCLVLCDLDGTMTIDATTLVPRAAEMRVRREVRGMLEELGGLMFVTMRSSELVWSEEIRRNSLEVGYDRPSARWKKEGGRYVYEDLDVSPYFSSCQDPQGLLAIGDGITIFKDGLAWKDLEYERLLNRDIPRWHTQVYLFLLSYVNADTHGDLDRSLSVLEDSLHWLHGKSNVAPLPYRIQMDFVGADGLERKKKIVESIHARRQDPNPEIRKIARALELVDESKPKEDKYTLYVLPRWGTKLRTAHYVLKRIGRALGRPWQGIQLYTFGDTMADYHMLTRGAFANEANGLLVGGSRLAPTLLTPKPHLQFAGVPLRWGTRVESNPAWPGDHKFHMPLASPRRVTLGDVAFRGTRGPETILQYLQYLRKTVAPTR